MIVAHLKRKLPIKLWNTDVVLPKGTKVHRVGSGWVVSSVDDLKRLTGNDHDPVYRYAWVPEEEVEFGL